MKNMMQKLKNKKKGFTLVEVIVVLVILAILAAIAIPALTGYISKAQEKAATSEARTVMVAVQTLASDQYVTSPTEDALQITDATTSAKRDMTKAEVEKAVTDLTG
ncbi:prepilin-type N-terminal cleavage/methylation domain-containing protein, partial [Akkermansia muciniphila]|uniref:prepilin-type N-terminal cleavage/methylation domain-containing protein n=1 Tax=Akkermansia muciniphila TaxID=239935 RepID=UPI0018778556